MDSSPETVALQGSHTHTTHTHIHIHTHTLQSVSLIRWRQSLHGMGLVSPATKTVPAQHSPHVAHTPKTIFAIELAYHR